MLKAHGLYGHIRNNDLRASALLCGFAVYVGLLWFAACLVYAATGLELRVTAAQLQTGHQLKISNTAFGVQTAEHVALAYAWVPVLLALAWLAYAYLNRRRLVREGTGAAPAHRSSEPKFHDLVETLAIGAGMPMPGIEIVESDALNAYASGWTPADSVIGVTRGLLKQLSGDEIEAVVAHEITHIRCRDVRLMTVAGVMVGILASGSRMLGGGKGGARSRNLLVRTSGGAGLVFVGAGLVIGTLAWALGMLSELALSRAREFVADAGAVELTKNPDALIRALRKISAQETTLDVPAHLRAMMTWSPFGGWVATHPSMENRIAALERYAGGMRAMSPAPQQGLCPAGIGAVAVPRAAAPRPFGRRASSP